MSYGFIGKYNFPSGATSSAFFPYNTEILEIRACEDKNNLTYFGLYEEEDGNNNLQGFGYETSSGFGIIYRMDILPLSDATFSVEFDSSGSDNSIIISFTDASHTATLITETKPANYECVLPYQGSEGATSILGLSATGPGIGNHGPPENIAITTSSAACYFYEPDSVDKTQWHPGDIENGVLISNNIQIGEYEGQTIESFGINLIARYDDTLFIEAFCRVTPRDSLAHIANHTVFCKTFSGLVLDVEPYRSCPLCIVSNNTVESCKQNTIVTTASPDLSVSCRLSLNLFIVLFVFVLLYYV